MMIFPRHPFQNPPPSFSLALVLLGLLYGDGKGVRDSEITKFPISAPAFMLQTLAKILSVSAVFFAPWSQYAGTRLGIVPENAVGSIYRVSPVG
jgi:hypothetical protein